MSILSLCPLYTYIMKNKKYLGKISWGHHSYIAERLIIHNPYVLLCEP